jgi:hypothetical protein
MAAMENLDERTLDRIGAALAALCLLSLVTWHYTASPWAFTAVLATAGTGLILERLWTRHNGRTPQ